MSRTAKRERSTAETQIGLSLDLDGGEASAATGVGFLDHMLDLLPATAGSACGSRRAATSRPAPTTRSRTSASCLGQALDEALGDRAGIRRYGSALVPMDESLAECAIDISGRPLCVFDADLPVDVDRRLRHRAGRGVLPRRGQRAKLTLHISVRYGTNAHHMIEACFKAFARALRVAVSVDPEETRRAVDEGDPELSDGVRICILDYGMGNLRSVEKALEHVGATRRSPATPATIRGADGLILPGVGAFPRAMERIRELGPRRADRRAARRRRPDPRHLPRAAAALRVDHRARRRRAASACSGRGRRARAPRPQGSPHRLVAGRAGSASRALTEGIETGTPFYFVHSFTPRPATADLLGTAGYGEPLRLRGRARQRLRRPVPPREVERAPGCACSPTSPAICAARPAAA